MKWRPDDFWQARLVEVIGAVIGDNNRKIEDMKLAWEPARFTAFLNWNLQADKRYKLKSEQQIRRFPWEAREVLPGDADKVRRQVMKFRSTIKDKWGLKYLNE